MSQAVPKAKEKKCVLIRVLKVKSLTCGSTLPVCKGGVSSLKQTTPKKKKTDSLRKGSLKQNTDEAAINISHLQRTMDKLAASQLYDLWSGCDEYLPAAWGDTL